MYTNKMRKIRLSKNMTMDDLADRTGLSVGYICHLERGSRSNPSVQVMESIAKALGETVIEIFFTE